MTVLILRVESLLPLVAGWGGLLAVIDPAFAQSWTTARAPYAEWSSVACSADGGKLVAAAFSGPIFTSSDAGATWKATRVVGASCVAGSADGTKLVAGVYGGAVYYSVDSGVTWSATSAPRMNWLSVASSADGAKLVAVGDGSPIYTSADSGATWSATSTPNTNWSSVASSADGTKLVAVVSGGPIYTSVDSGDSWKVSSAPGTNWSSVASSADGTKLVAVVDGGPIYTSVDSGDSWKVSNAPSTNWSSVASSADGTKLVAVGYFGRIYLTANAGVTWTTSEAPSMYATAVASSADGTKLVLTASNQIYTSADSGATWMESSVWGSAVASSADGSKIIAVEFIGGCGDGYCEPGMVFTSTDSGLTWTESNEPNGSATSVATSADGIKLIIGTPAPPQYAQQYPSSGLVYTSTNSGMTWSSVSVPPGYWQAVASSADGNKLVVASDRIYTLQSTPAPVLTIASTDDNLVISWTVPSMNFVLEQNSDFTPTTWRDVTTPPTLKYKNLQYQVTLPRLGPTRWFHLVSR